MDNSRLYGTRIRWFKKKKITKGDRIDSIINMEPSDFLIMKNQQEMLTSPELSDYIEKQRRRGFANIKEFWDWISQTHCHVVCLLYPDADWSVFVFQENERWNGIAFRYRLGIEFLLYSVSDHCFHICRERQHASGHRCVDTEYNVCLHCILSI